MSITVSISVVQTRAPDVDADEMLDSRRSPSLIPDSVGVDHPCCRKPHGSLGIILTDWNDLLVDSQSLCSYSVEQITVLH